MVLLGIHLQPLYICFRVKPVVALGAYWLRLMVANFLGELTLPAGVLGHEGSTLLVTLNGLRLLRT
jgi:cation transport ATPase